MTSKFRALTHGAVAAAALGIAFAACAQSSQTSLAKEIGDAGPQAGKSFVDLSVGKATYNTSCGNVAGLTCSRGTTSYSLTAGNMITDNVGIELSAMNLGKANVAGGSVIARGINLAAVGRVPLGDTFAVEGKVGPTYGVTHVTAATESGLVTGRASGVGLGYGVALDVNVARGLHGSLGWEQHDFKFAGQGRSNVKNVTLALGYTF
ncbi:outer membrane beta-barrel protein [Scleromatobacter humisilvae]|uniref:Outer membrane beta-barrel protein n=1 Tax=Scleromatobacter humisilvae TaxID=2897159 RepID=A0A9X1YHC5_9BURK|nr:outer membrane beta-barrel protein [Scleromatobacter humisilvae]MCK9686123.1 outer membrane beta-barrel protein [Scleromatobacter humisilvae]